MTVGIEHEVFTKTFPTKPGRYIMRRRDLESFLTITKKGPIDLIYSMDGTTQDQDFLCRISNAEYCRMIPSRLAEECYAEGWHAARYASEKPLGSYFPSYWNDDTFSKRMSEGK
jgi:hypothetical protein